MNQSSAPTTAQPQLKIFNNEWSKGHSQFGFKSGSVL